MLLLLGRSLLLSHVLWHSVLTLLEVLTRRHVVLLLELVWVLCRKSVASSNISGLHLQRLLVPSRLSLQDDVDTYKLPFATIDRTPLVLYARNTILDSPVIFPEFGVLIFNKLVDDPATV
jgi:hypothetical protein